jgi:hypothetical protein
MGGDGESGEEADEERDEDGHWFWEVSLMSSTRTRGPRSLGVTGSENSTT